MLDSICAYAILTTASEIFNTKKNIFHFSWQKIHYILYRSIFLISDGRPVFQQRASCRIPDDPQLLLTLPTTVHAEFVEAFQQAQGKRSKFHKFDIYQKKCPQAQVLRAHVAIISIAIALGR